MSNSRYTLFPIKDDDIWRRAKQALACFWTVEEIDFSKDKDDWEKLTDSERFFIKRILAFFAGADGIVLENLMENFFTEVKLMESRYFYAVQEMMEAIHSETYSTMIQTYVKDEAEKEELFQAMEFTPCIRKKGEWAQKWMNPEQPFSQRLLAFACVEGIFFSGSFCAIFWLKKRGLMPGLTFSNELISRDEGLHTEFAALLFKKRGRQVTQEVAYKIVREAVEIEQEFICDSIPCSMIGMNTDLMTEYIKFVADYLLVMLGYSKLYGAVNTFSFMELISVQGKTNFFESRVSQYQKAGVDLDTKDTAEYGLDEDF
jgi:ribonucleoside-diphosphate reductase beta chain